MPCGFCPIRFYSPWPMNGEPMTCFFFRRSHLWWLCALLVIVFAYVASWQIKRIAAGAA